MKVNVEVVMSPKEYEEAKQLQEEYSKSFDTIEALVLEWVDNDFIDYVNDFIIKVKETENNGEMENCCLS
jgi:hypothetical protein